MSEKTVDFKFEIGDVVQFKDKKIKERSLFRRLKLDEKDKFIKPQPFVVVSMTYEQCYGGSQTTYYLRAMSYIDSSITYRHQNQSGLFEASEIELEEYEN